MIILPSHRSSRRSLWAKRCALTATQVESGLTVKFAWPSLKHIFWQTYKKQRGGRIALRLGYYPKWLSKAICLMDRWHFWNNSVQPQNMRGKVSVFKCTFLWRCRFHHIKDRMITNKVPTLISHDFEMRTQRWQHHHVWFAQLKSFSRGPNFRKALKQGRSG